MSSSALKCVEALSDLIQELIAQVNQASEDGENPASSDDELVKSIIEQMRVGPNSLRGIEALMKSAVKSQNKSCSGPLTFLSSAIGGFILPFYSRACLMSLTETAFPVIWTITRNRAVPPAGSLEYALVYLPALEHAQGQAFMNSGPILSGVWVVGSGISYGVWKLIIWSSNAAHHQIVRIYHFCESQRGNRNRQMDQTGNEGNSIEMSVPLLTTREDSLNCDEPEPLPTEILGPEQSLD